MHPGARMAARVEREPERLDDRRPDVVRERHLGLSGDVLAEHAEALVRVDPPPPGRRDRRLALERQAGGVREQMTDGCARRPRRLVEVDDALLGRDERRERGDRLRDRREAHGTARVPAGVAIAPSARVTPAAANGHVPGVDLVQRLHGARYYVPPDGAQADHAATRPTRVSPASLAPSSPATVSTSPARRRSRPTARRRPRAPTSRPRSACEIIGEALEPRRLRARARGAHEHLRDGRASTGRRSPGRTATSFARLRPAATCVVAPLLDPAWKVEIEAEAVLP